MAISGPLVDTGSIIVFDCPRQRQSRRQAAWLPLLGRRHRLGQIDREYYLFQWLTEQHVEQGEKNPA